MEVSPAKETSEVLAPVTLNTEENIPGTPGEVYESVMRDERFPLVVGEKLILKVQEAEDASTPEH